MTPENFCYWLQGYFEIQQPEKINSDKIEMIQNHLDLVFNKVTTKESQLSDKFRLKKTEDIDDILCGLSGCDGYDYLKTSHTGSKSEHLC